MFSSCLILSSIVLPWSSACWWCPPCWLCYATYGGEVSHVSSLISSCLIMSFSLSSQISLCSIMFSSHVLTVDHVFTCPPMFSSCWLCPHMFSSLVDYVFLSFLRDILMRIATILWSVWSDDCLKLPVKLSFYVSLFHICFISFSFYCYDDLILSLFRWC